MQDEEDRVTEVYGSARPRKRRGRRLLITFLVLLLLIAGALLVADRFAASYAEREIGDRVAQQVADQKATSEQPDVRPATARPSRCRCSTSGRRT
jgi:hypothetical protein